MGFYRWTRLDEKTSIMCVGCAKGSICFTNDKINDGNCAGYIIIDDKSKRDANTMKNPAFGRGLIY